MMDIHQRESTGSLRSIRPREILGEFNSPGGVDPKSGLIVKIYQQLFWFVKIYQQPQRIVIICQQLWLIIPMCF